MKTKKFSPANGWIAFSLFLIALLNDSCSPLPRQSHHMTVSGPVKTGKKAFWLSHEHILVDFVGAGLISRERWNVDSVMVTMLPYLRELPAKGVRFFVDATPYYLGRDIVLLQKMAEASGLQIITNTGLYGAVQNKYLPAYVNELPAERLADQWTEEFEKGIEGSEVKPGFIKISVDAKDTLHPLHQKLVKAAALTHLRTGLTIASHTGEARGLWPQLDILKQEGVSPGAFIWVHAQNEKDPENYVRAAREGCWISLDGLGWALDPYLEKLVFAKKNDILHRMLISHDAGWYDPAKPVQNVQPYTRIFDELIPGLRSRGFSKKEIHGLLSRNPALAFSIRVLRKERK